VQALLGPRSQFLNAGPLSVVPDAQRRRNIKKLPLISHKAAAKQTDALEVLTAYGRQARSSLLGLGPLGT
jgi:hypothetical protein